MPVPGVGDPDAAGGGGTYSTATTAPRPSPARTYSTHLFASRRVAASAARRHRVSTPAPGSLNHTRYAGIAAYADFGM
jgi:hypothetical protein